MLTREESLGLMGVGIVFWCLAFFAYGCADVADDCGASAEVVQSADGVVPRGAVILPWKAPEEECAASSEQALVATMPTSVAGTTCITSTDPSWPAFEAGPCFWDATDPTGSAATYVQRRDQSSVSRSLGLGWTCAAPQGTTVTCRNDGTLRPRAFACPEGRYVKPSMYVLNNGGTLFYDFDTKYTTSVATVSTTPLRIRVGQWSDGTTALWCDYAGAKSIVVRKR